MNNVDKFLERLKTFKPLIDENKIPKKSFDATRSYLELPHFNRSVPASCNSHHDLESTMLQCLFVLHQCGMWKTGLAYEVVCMLLTCMS